MLIFTWSKNLLQLNSIISDFCKKRRQFLFSSVFSYRENLFGGLFVKKVLLYKLTKRIRLVFSSFVIRTLHFTGHRQGIKGIKKSGT